MKIELNHATSKACLRMLSCHLWGPQLLSSLGFRRMRSGTFSTVGQRSKRGSSTSRGRVQAEAKKRKTSRTSQLPGSPFTARSRPQPNRRRLKSNIAFSTFSRWLGKLKLVFIWAWAPGRIQMTSHLSYEDLERKSIPATLIQLTSTRSPTWTWQF